MKPLLLKYLLLFSLIKNFSAENKTNCTQDIDVKSINDCIKFTSKEVTPQNYCCMLNIKVGGSSKSLCTEISQKNYDNVIKKYSVPYYLINGRFEYKLYCNNSGTYIIILNNILYLLITILLI